MTRKEWHWQERLTVNAAPDEAWVREALHLHADNSYRLWLKHKRQKAKASAPRHRADKQEGEKEDKQGESDAAFREWLARKKREHRKDRKQRRQEAAKSDKKPEHPPASGKPPSQHVNPTIKRKKAATKPIKKPKHSDEAVTEAYAAWLARVRLEDRVRRAQRLEALAADAEAARARHHQTWTKKLVVCAYSTAGRDL